MMLFETLLSIFKLCLAISVQDDEHTNQTTLYMEPCYYNNEPNVRNHFHESVTLSGHRTGI